MNPFEAIVIIAVFAIIASVIKNKRRHPNDDDRHDQHQDEEAVDNQQMQLELMAMKKRVEALEAIVTDKSYNLKREIDDL
jgi:hypothetical protein